MATKKSELVLTCNATAIKDVMNFLNQKLDELIRKRDQLNAKGVQNWTAQDKKNFKQWGDDIAAINSAMQKNRDEMVKYAQVMKDLAGSKTKDLKRALGEVKRALDNMSARDPGRAQLEADLKKIQRQIDANTVSVKKNQSAWGALGTTMKNLFAYAGIFAGFNLLKSKMDEAYEANKRFSDSMANVRKVSGLTMDEIGKLANNLSKIDSRTGLGGLMELGYTGAKLGFGNYGIEGLESFAKSAVKVQNALSEDMGADAMTALSKMVEVMGLIPKMGVERAMDATGSAIFKLASTSTATGTNIVEFSKRLMGLANIAHITTPELLAIGSAADSMALMPEVAATAFNKLISAMQKQPNLIENALKIDKGTISDLYQAGKMTDAMVLVFEKMREKGGMNALMQSGVFKDLGSDGARLVAVMATMANRVDMLNAHLAVSRQAFEEGTAVAQEYAIQMDTAAAYSERAANIWEKAFVNPEGVDTVKEFTKAWYEVSKALTSNKFAMAEVKFLLGGILELLKGILYFLPALLSGLAILGAGRMFVALRSAFEMTRLSAVGLTLSLNGIKTAWTALSAVGKANWISAAATALFMIIEAFGMFNKKVQEATGYMKGFKKDLGDLNVEYGKAESELRRYRRAIDEANTGSKQRLAAINTFNSKFKPYLSNLLTEKSTALDVAKAYNEVTKAIRAKLALQLKEKDIESQVAPREQWTAERRQEYEKTVRGTQNSQYGAEWITGYAQDNRGKSIRDIARDLNERIFHTAESTFNSVFSQLGSSTLNELVRTKRKVNGHTVIDENVMGPQGRQLWAAMRYILQERSAENALRRTNKKWEPEQKLIDDLTAQQDETPYEPLQDAPDKDAARAAKKAEAEHKQAIRKDLQDAKQESDAIIAKIEEWYRLQETVVTGFAADGKWTQQQAEMVNRELEAAKNEALANARLAISGRDTQTWEQTKESLRVMMFDTGEWSQELFQQILDVSMSAISNKLAKIDAAGGKYGITTSSLKDGLDKNAAGNRRKVQELRNKTAKEVEKALLQYDYFEQAARAYEDRLTQLGLLTETAEQAADRIRKASGSLKAGNKTEEQMTADRSAARRQAGQQFIKNPGKSYAVDYTDTASLNSWLQDFSGAKGTIGTGGMEFQFSGWAEAFKDQFNLWLKDSETYKADIQGFYLSLVDFDTAYYDAVKQNYDKQKKQFDSRWNASGKGQAYEEMQSGLDRMGREQKMTGADQGTNFAQQAGFAALGTDPEIAASQLRMQQMQDELAMFIEVNEKKKLEGAALEAFNQQVAERQRAVDEAQLAMAETVMSKINDRISKLQEWTAPIEQFGADVGDAMGNALNGTQSMAEGMQEALKKVVQAWGQSTIDIVKQLLMQQLRQRLIGKAMGKQAKQNQEEQTDIAEEGGERRMKAEAIMETGLASITQQMGQQILSTKAEQDQQETQMEGQKARGGIMAGIAEGAAKIIGSLGWWGIPLVAVITALLNGLLSMALNALFGGSSSANNNANAAAKPKIKLASGMLTYDEGNVQTVVGDDGRVYRAREQRSLPEGVSMVTEPIATRVNGQQALVGERGPEIVIGRRTTRAIQMNRPDLLRDLAMIDRGITTRKVRTFDEGNISDMASAFAGQLPAPQQGQQGSEDSPEMRQTLDSLSQTVAALSATVLQLQKNGIPSYIKKYGTGGLIDEVQSGLKFVSKYK